MADEQNAIDQDADAFYDEKQIELNRKVMEKAATDEEFRAHMQENPQEALEKAGLADEAKALAASDAEEGDDDVAGHHWAHATYYRTCRWWQQRIYWHRK